MKKGIVFLVLVAIPLLAWSFTDSDPSDAQLQQAQKAALRHAKLIKNNRYITLIDYSKPIFSTRLWVYDRVTRKIVLSSHVAHAFSSGLIHATDFSNTNGSKKSCVGSFVTGEDYTGKFGYALRVAGLDTKNDHTLARAIVFHAYRGLYTHGCFGTQPKTNNKLISLIKGGSFVYVAR